jgi:hypothetical protein
MPLAAEFAFSISIQNSEYKHAHKRREQRADREQPMALPAGNREDEHERV